MSPLALLAHAAARPDAHLQDVSTWIQTLLETPDAAAAVAAARAGRARFPASPQMTALLACALIRSGAPDEGLALRGELTGVEGEATYRGAIAAALASVGLGDRAEVEFSAAVAAFPKVASLWLRYVDFVTARQRPERALGLLRAARRQVPGDAALAAAEAQTLEKLEGFNEALQAWDVALALAPDESEWHDGRARTLLAASRVDEAFQAWEAAVARFPEANTVRMHLALAFRARGEPLEVARVLRPWAERSPMDPLPQLALGEALLSASQEEAIPALRRALVAGADEELTTALLSRALAEFGPVDEALETHARVLAMAPGDERTRHSLVLLCLRIGDLACAETELGRQLARDPFDARARELLETVLVGHPEQAQRVAAATRFRAASADPELAALAARARPPDAGTLATVLRDEREVLIEDLRVARLLQRRSILLQRPEARARYGEIIVSFNVHHPPILRRARTLTPEGVIHELSPSDQSTRDPHAGGPLRGDARELVLRFPALEPGSILDYEVEVPYPHPEALGAFWDRYILANLDPTLRSLYLLDVPVGTRLSTHAPQMPPPTRERQGGRERLTWRRDDLAPSALEGGALAPVATVSVTNLESWSQVSRWYRELFAPAARVTPAILAAAQQATAGAKSREARIEALFALVEDQTEYVGDELGIGAYRPRAAEKTLQTRRGDCKDVTALLSALLKAVDIESHPALIRPDGPGVFGEVHPTPAQFNHVLLHIPDPAGDLFVDPTARLGTLRAVPAILRGRSALLVKADGGTLVRIPTGDSRHARLDDRLDFRMTTTGGGRLTRTVSATGDVAAEVRQRLLPLPKADQDALLRAPGLLLGGVHVPDRVQVSGLVSKSQPLGVLAELSTADLVGLRTDGALVLRLQLDALVAPVLAGGAGGPGAHLSDREMTRILRLEPPGGQMAFTWAPLKVRARERFGELRVDELRARGATEITMHLRVSALPQDASGRAAWIADMETLRGRLDRELVMRPGPGFKSSRFFESLAAERPGDGRLALLQARALIADGDLPEAREVLGTAVRAHPEDGMVLRLWLDVLGVDSATAAVPWSEVDAAAARHSRDAGVWVAIGDLAGRRDDPARAERAYREALRIDADDGRALNNLAWLLRDAPEARAEALSLARRAVAALPESDAAWDTLAELLFASGDLEGALSAIERASTHGDASRKGLYETRRARYREALKRRTGTAAPTR